MDYFIRPAFSTAQLSIETLVLSKLYLGFDSTRHRTTILEQQETISYTYSDKIQHYSNYIPWPLMLRLISANEEFNSYESVLIHSLNYNVPPYIARNFGLVDPLHLLFYVHNGRKYERGVFVRPEDIIECNTRTIKNSLKLSADDTRLEVYSSDELLYNLQSLIDCYRQDYLKYWNIDRVLMLTSTSVP